MHFWLIHVIGLVLWLGGLIAYGLAPARIDGTAEADRMRHKLLYWMAWPGFVLVLLGGLGLLHAIGMVMFQEGWFHVKLTLATILLVIQALLSFTKLRPGAWLLPVAFVSLVAGLFLVHFRPF